MSGRKLPFKCGFYDAQWKSREGRGLGTGNAQPSSLAPPCSPPAGLRGKLAEHSPALGGCQAVASRAFVLMIFATCVSESSYKNIMENRIFPLEKSSATTL